MTKNYELHIKLNEPNGEKVFSESYKVALREDFVKNGEDFKGHSFKNHVHGFLTLLGLNNRKLPNIKIVRWNIHPVRFGLNSGSEINGTRPSIVLTTDSNETGKDTLVIPLTSALREKKTDPNDVLVTKDKDNNLYQHSYARLRQLRAVSFRRIGEPIGVITNEQAKHSIINGIQSIMGINA